MTYFYEIVFWLLLGALWWHFYWPHRRYWVDETRHRLFIIRDKLFDEAASGSVIQFNDEAYGMVRITINGMLRTLEDWSVWRILLVAWRYKRYAASHAMYQRYQEKMDLAVKKLSPAGRVLVDKTMRDAADALGNHVVRISLPLCILCNGFFLLSWVVRRAREAEPLSLWKMWMRPVNFESNLAGHDNFWSAPNGARGTV